MLLASCGGSSSADASDDAEAAAPTPANENAVGEDDPPEPTVDPEPFIPAGRVGDADSYAELTTALEALVPPELRAGVPWPDLRNPDPVVAQLDIFAMWIWMTENNPDPVLIDVIAHPDGPNREEVAAIFGELHVRDQVEVRTQAPYRAFDHRVVTFESAGLPLWLARDVPTPEQAVVVYYSDDSGPVERRDRISGEVFETRAATSTRSWVSIMVPTDVGWLLWRDELIEPGDPELEIPDLELPAPDDGQPRPQV